MTVRKYFLKRCTRCDAYIEIAIPKVGRTTAVRVYAITGRCLECGYRIDLVGFHQQVGSRPTEAKARYAERIPEARYMKTVTALFRVFVAAIAFILIFYATTLLMSYFFGPDFAPISF